MSQDRSGEGDVPVRLPIRVRRVELGEGQRAESCSVHCPIKNDSVSLDHCAECSRFSTIVAHLTDPRSSLFCSVPGSALPDLEIPPGTLGQRMDTARVTEAMATEVICIDSELGLREALELLEGVNHRAAPVVDDEGVLVGVVNSAVLQRAQVERPGLLVEEVMTDHPLQLRETDTLMQAVELLSRSGNHELPVVSGTDQVVGMLSSSDLVRWMARERLVQEPG